MEEEGKKYENDVFLSFSGEDTRKNFTEDLYQDLMKNGIKTFIDDYDLGRGKEIAKDLFKGIGESKSAIVVFSEKYVFSSWCLDELVRIDQCREENGLIVFPVFCDVDRSHLINQEGKVKDAFDKYEETFKDKAQTVKQWREALTRIANIDGRHLKDYRYV
ncbi:hypothetical protein TIFTF001_033588 [Ficus carica]|uniref:TIR domain-containing protein n=1 Tax=Ficus carica TaxID=3494 RepID=A0AA88J9D4_FICCA|nr:hypothetical protein TIFTF001_033588 [Ficus carica]